jgi:hypothetical protein
MNVKLTRSDWKAVLEAALSISREWEREPMGMPRSWESPAVLLGGRPDEDRATILRRHVELEIETLEMLYARRDLAEPLIEVPPDIEGELRRLLWK